MPGCLYVRMLSPPHTSSYYVHDPETDLESHVDALNRDIAYFKALGEVIVMGDLNARSGVLEDRCDATENDEWSGMRTAGIEVPSELIAASSHTHAICVRRNQDITVNLMGQQVVRMCRDHGMVILNGRLPGDAEGKCTYFADGRKGRSLIDYFISTPSLVYTLSGEPKPGSHLHITDMASCPQRPGGGNFDHVPVVLSICVDLQHAPEPCVTDIGQQESIRYRWKPENAIVYNDILLNETNVLQCFEHMHESSGNVNQAEQHFTSAIKAAIACLHASVGGVIASSGQKQEKKVGRPTNSWYDDACKQARQVYIDADRVFGAGSDAARGAFQAYRRTTRAARRTWEAKEARGFLDALHHEPKKFWSSYKEAGSRSDVIRDSEWKGYFENLFNPSGFVHAHHPCHEDPMHACMFPDPDEHKINVAAALNCAISVDEVVSVIDKALCGKSPGVDGLPMEFFKCAVMRDVDGVMHNVLAKHIAYVFNQVLTFGYPESWTVGAIVPVPKPKGNADNKDDYRGITVGVALSKLYSMVLLQRLDAWAEANGMRARGQAGFRSGRGTPDNAFVLNHVIEKYKAAKKPVYAAFIDFRKAYDCVDRALLWRCLRSLGLHGRILESLIEMYTDVKICVRVGGKLSESFRSDVGVKQGDPLSPLLFGLFIDRMEGVIRDKLPATSGVRLLDMYLKILLYADDLVLLAESPAELQSMLDLLHTFCLHNALTVNIKKSEVVVFNGQYCSRRGVQIQYSGSDMKVVPCFVYLGILYDETTGVKGAAKRGMDKGRRAMFAMLKRCHELNIHNVGLKCHLFDALVRPVVNYGCEVWAPSVMASGDHFIAGLREEAEKFHLAFLRQCLGVRKCTHTAALMHEMGRLPLAFNWIKQVLNFWNKICLRAHSDLAKMALVESMTLARDGVNACWAGQLARCLRRYGFDLLNHGEVAMDVTSIMAMAQKEWWTTKVETSPAINDESRSVVRDQDDGQRDGFKFLTYSRWFACNDGDLSKRFWFHLTKRAHIQILAQFRLGSHWLNIECERFVRPFVPRSKRVCKCCGMGSREDEIHLILQCPLYAGLRSQFPELFGNVHIIDGDAAPDDAVMSTIMNVSCQCVDIAGFWQSLAVFLVKCKALRSDTLVSSDV